MATTTQMTWESFEKLPDGDGMHRELIEGELQILPPPKSRSQQSGEATRTGLASGSKSAPTGRSTWRLDSSFLPTRHVDSARRFLSCGVSVSGRRQIRNTSSALPISRSKSSRRRNRLPTSIAKSSFCLKPAALPCGCSIRNNEKSAYFCPAVNRAEKAPVIISSCRDCSPAGTSRLSICSKIRRISEVRNPARTHCGMPRIRPKTVRTSSDPTAKFNPSYPFSLKVFTPRTLPPRFTSGPPLFPGLRVASIWR